ncbi:hypothetical protein U1Q18_045906 [Sarracenia purpurea var. burkii]
MEFQKHLDKENLLERNGKKRELEEELDEDREISLPSSGAYGDQALLGEVSAHVDILKSTSSWKESDRVAAKLSNPTTETCFYKTKEFDIICHFFMMMHNKMQQNEPKKHTIFLLSHSRDWFLPTLLISWIGQSVMTNMSARIHQVPLPMVVH